MWIWAAITVTLTMMKRISAMNSYPQIKKVIHSLWESPKITLNVARCLTRSVRSTRWTRTGRPVSSRRALLTGALCIAFALPNPTYADSQASKDCTDHVRLDACASSDLIKIHQTNQIVAKIIYQILSGVSRSRSCWIGVI